MKGNRPTGHSPLTGQKEWAGEWAAPLAGAGGWAVFGGCRGGWGGGGGGWRGRGGRLRQRFFGFLHAEAKGLVLKLRARAGRWRERCIPRWSFKAVFWGDDNRVITAV
jgi:hypothetical protein